MSAFRGPMERANHQWEPVGDVDGGRIAATKALAGTISWLQPGQFFIPRTFPLGADADPSVCVAVTHYGHNLPLVDVPVNGMLPPELELGGQVAADLAESGFSEPTGSIELIRHLDTWQRPFDAFPLHAPGTGCC